MKKIIFIISLIIIFNIDPSYSQGATITTQVGSSMVRLGNTIEVKVKFYWTYPNSVDNPTYENVRLRLYKQNETFENGGSPIVYFPDFNIPNTPTPNWNGVWYSTYVTIPNDIPQGIYHIRAHISNWPGGSSTRSDYTQNFTVSTQPPTSNNPTIYLNSKTKNSLTISSNRNQFTNQYRYTFTAYSSDGVNYINGSGNVYEDGINNPVGTINGLDPETEYCIKVRAYNAANESTSNSDCFNFITSPLLDDSPSNLNATTISGNQINLTWDDNNNEETFFEVERSLSSTSGFELIATLNSDTTDYTDIGIESNTSYYYRVRAGNDNGHSAYSNIANAMTLDSPVIFNDIDFYNQGTTANASNPENYLNQELPIRFKVKIDNELTQSLSTLTGIITSTTPGITITDNTVSFGTVGSGASIWSNDEFEIIADGTVPDGSTLEFQLSLEDAFVSGDPWVSSFSFPINPLANGTINLADISGNNDGIPEPGENAIKLQPTISNISNNSIANVYGTLSNEEGILTITNDNEKYNWESNIHEPILPTDSNIIPEEPFEFNYPSNEPLQELNFNLELQGKLNDSNGALLKWQTTFTYNEGVEPPPVIVSTNPIDDAVDIAIDTNLEIVFDKNVNAVSGKYMRIYDDSNTLFSSIEATDSQVSISTETVTVNPTTDLQGGTNYYITIDQGAFTDNATNDFAGISSPTEWNFTTLQSNPPNAPTLTATAISESEIQLNWNTVDTATNYHIYSCDESVTYTTSVTTNSFIVDNLNGSTEYNFIVKAENQAGLSDASNCANATTHCGHPWGSPVIFTTFTRAFGNVTIDGQPATVEDKVGAFVNNELRGVGSIVIIDGEAISQININGNIVENVSFKIWDHSACLEVPVQFTVDSSPPNTIGLPDYLPIAGDTSGLSINEEEFSGLTIYPNPTKDDITIEANEIINSIEVYSVLGVKVLRIDNIDSKSTTISLEHLNSGNYFLMIKGDNIKSHKQIIKN